MKSIYNEYKGKLVEGIDKVKGANYVDFNKSIIDDLEVTFADEVGKKELNDLQDYYGIER